MDETVKCEVKDARGCVVIVRVDDPLGFDCSVLNRGFMKAGAAMVIVAKPNDNIEFLSDEALKRIGLKRINKQKWGARLILPPGLSMKDEPLPPESA